MGEETTSEKSDAPRSSMSFETTDRMESLARAADALEATGILFGIVGVLLGIAIYLRDETRGYVVMGVGTIGASISFAVVVAFFARWARAWIAATTAP